LSTLALEGSSGDGASSRALLALRYADLIALAVALPVFLVVGASMLGYGVLAAVWIAQRALQFAAERSAARSLAAGVRRTALGTLAATTLVRLWLVTLAILLVGLLGERRAGLAAAVLALVLVTFSLGGQALARLFSSPEEPKR
jgi:hypothetical protein